MTSSALRTTRRSHEEEALQTDDGGQGILDSAVTWKVSLERGIKLDSASARGADNDGK